MTPMWSCIRLYSPGIVLLSLSAMWALGIRGQGMIGVSLLVTGLAAIVAQVERGRRRREAHRPPA